jgi:Flp pilus assembly pilin Flp
MSGLNQLLLRLRDDCGASLVEYAMLLAFIVLVCLAAMTFLGTQTSTGITESSSSLFGN